MSAYDKPSEVLTASEVANLRAEIDRLRAQVDRFADGVFYEQRLNGPKNIVERLEYSQRAVKDAAELLQKYYIDAASPTDKRTVDREVR